MNPVATTTQGWIREAITDAFAQLGTVEVQLTEARGHAHDVAARACRLGVQRIVTFGGDGTINETVNGLLSVDAPRPTLLTVPGGHTNVFARLLGIPQDPLEATGALIEGVVAGRTRTVTVGRADDRYFLCSAGLGLDAEVLRRVEQQRAQGARASIPRFVASAIVAQATYGPLAKPRISIELPAKPGTDEHDPRELGSADPGSRIDGVYTAIVQNGPVWTYAGSLPLIFAPGATFDNGLSVFGIRSQDPLRLARHLARATLRPDWRGGDSAASDLAALRLTAREPTPFQVDGDVIGDRQLVSFSAHSAALTVGLPADDAALA